MLQVEVVFALPLALDTLAAELMLLYSRHCHCPDSPLKVHLDTFCQTWLELPLNGMTWSIRGQLASRRVVCAVGMSR